jgi:hypothetical protein
VETNEAEAWAHLAAAGAPAGGNATQAIAAATAALVRGGHNVIFAHSSLVYMENPCRRRI